MFHHNLARPEIIQDDVKPVNRKCKIHWIYQVSEPADGGAQDRSWMGSSTCPRSWTYGTPVQTGLDIDGTVGFGCAAGKTKCGSVWI